MNLFRKLIAIGVDHKAHPASERRIILSNIVGAIFGATILGISAYFIAFEIWALALFSMVFAVVMFSSIFTNALRKHFLSQINLIFSTNILGLILCLLLGKGTALAAGFFCLVGAPVLLLPPKKKGIIFLGSLLPLACFAISQWLPIDISVRDGLLLDDSIKKFIYPLFFTVIFMEIFYLQYVSLMIEKKLIFQISEREKAEFEREQARSSALGNSKLAALGEMASGIAHELNTPLGALKLRASQLNRLLKNTPAFDGKVEKITKDMDFTIDSMTKIINGLRAVARTADNDPFQPERVELVVKDAVNLCSERLKHHNVKLKVDPISEPLAIICRRVQIVQILVNLISNAKHAVSNTDEARISIWTKEKPKYVEIMVEDNGVGISSEVSDKIMNPFFTTKDVGHGTGVGLSISLKIAEDHGGSLFLENNKDPTRFSLRIPKSE